MTLLLHMHKSNDAEHVIKLLKIAQSELNRCSRIFSTQAQFYLTLHTALLGMVALVFIYVRDYLLLMFVNSFGVFISIIWLLYGNRIACYLRLTEKCIIELESRANIKIKRYQTECLSKKNNLSFLERYSSSFLIKTILPCGIMIFWVLMLILCIFYCFSTLQPIN